MSIHCFKDLIKYGAQETLQKEYGEWLVRTEAEGKEADYDVTLCIDLEKIPEDDGGCEATGVEDNSADSITSQ